MDPPSVATQGLTAEPPQSLEGRESESDVTTPPPKEIPPRQEMSNDEPLGSGEEAVEDPGWLVWARQIFREKGAPLPASDTLPAKANVAMPPQQVWLEEGFRAVGGG